MWNIALVAQRGRIAYQALLCAASIREHHGAGQIRIHICVPNNSRRWKTDPSLNDIELIEAFRHYGCEIAPFDNKHFGSAYPHSNKFYAISSLPPEEPFMFLDSDTILTDALREDVDFSLPVLKPAPKKWPIRRGNSPSIGEIWRSLYEFFDLDPEPYFDASRGDSKYNCFPYYNASVIYYERGGIFGKTMLKMGKRLWRHPPDTLRRQPLVPWLDQIVLPLVLAKLGVPRIKEPELPYKQVVHYRVPAVLLLRSRPGFAAFESLAKRPQLASVLNHDPGFRYYMSEEGRELVASAEAEAKASLGSNDRKVSQKALLRVLEKRTEIIR